MLFYLRFDCLNRVFYKRFNCRNRVCCQRFNIVSIAGGSGRTLTFQLQAGLLTIQLQAGQEGGYTATWNLEFKLPWREAALPNHHDDKMDSDQ